MKPKIGTKKGVIDEYGPHRWNAIWRRRLLTKLQNDIENGLYELDEMSEKIVGEYKKDKDRRIKLRKRAWMCLWIFIGFVFLYCIIKQL